jgi:hypothetical protein
VDNSPPDDFQVVYHSASGSTGTLSGFATETFAAAYNLTSLHARYGQIMLVLVDANLSVTSVC